LLVGHGEEERVPTIIIIITIIKNKETKKLLVGAHNSSRAHRLSPMKCQRPKDQPFSL